MGISFCCAVAKIFPVSAPVKSFGGEARDGPLLSTLRRLQRQPRVVRGLGALALFTLVAWLDFTLDKDLSLFAIYLIPTLYSAWLLGVRWGYVCCFASAAVWVIDDWGVGLFRHHALIPYWNVAGRLTVLLFIVAIVNALKRLLEDEYEGERRRIQREFEVASEVQNSLLPSHTPHYPGLDFGFYYQPAREVGGDYYDFIPLDPETYRLRRRGCFR